MSPQRELTSKRPTNYSAWHRANLPDWCYNTDGDWFEQRVVSSELLPVAYIETIEVPPLFIQRAQQEYPLWPSKKSLIQAIYNHMELPCFVVRHTSDCKTFCVSRITINGHETEAIIMTEEQYKNWVLNLFQ